MQLFVLVAVLCGSNGQCDHHALDSNLSAYDCDYYFTDSGVSMVDKLIIETGYSVGSLQSLECIQEDTN